MGNPRGRAARADTLTSRLGGGGGFAPHKGPSGDKRLQLRLQRAGMLKSSQDNRESSEKHTLLFEGHGALLYFLPCPCPECSPPPPAPWTPGAGHSAEAWWLSGVPGPTHSVLYLQYDDHRCPWTLSSVPWGQERPQLRIIDLT